jgi:hypothetical protein
MASITRGSDVLTLTKAPKVLGRYNEGGPDRVAVDSLAGTPIVSEFVNAELRRRLRLRLEVLTETEAETLRDILDGTGALTVELGGGAPTITAAVVSSKLEAVVGDYPETAPTGNRYHRAELELAIL